MRLKRWESPRREGRNDKGRGGAARKRQLKKQQQMLRRKLKEGNNPNNNKNNKQGEEKLIFPLFLLVHPLKANCQETLMSGRQLQQERVLPVA